MSTSSRSSELLLGSLEAYRRFLDNFRSQSRCAHSIHLTRRLSRSKTVHRSTSICACVGAGVNEDVDLALGGPLRTKLVELTEISLHCARRASLDSMYGIVLYSTYARVCGASTSEVVLGHNKYWALLGRFQVLSDDMVSIVLVLTDTNWLALLSSTRAPALARLRRARAPRRRSPAYIYETLWMYVRLTARKAEL